ncbi:Gfo/Idh/MocA family protein [Telmatospirillum sp. J64-1]|uniref:Gfo/Idh/MocA family protein n=1 Tax=Telmatospirillum sp. J64-1 TaxID=2502183 RepID=UPI00115F11D6|nr:Gfo/Idh/MocA family oxidoreductase [Telmatospirillum sp. J64-1]
MTEKPGIEKDQDERGEPLRVSFLSRRRFLQGAGGGLLAATSLSTMAAAQERLPVDAIGRPDPQMTTEPPIEPERRVGYAVVGLGQYALNQIIPSFAESRSSRLVALVSGNREKAERTADLYGVSHDAIYDYDSYDRIAENDEIEAVYVILPPALHAEYSIRAARAGKHVLCEKPMAMNAEECAAMIQAASEAGRKLMIGYREHYEPHNLEAIRRIREGELGTVRVIQTDTSRPINPDVPADQWRVQRDLAGGGSLFDIGIYGVNGARYLSGEEPVEIRAMTHTPEGDARFGDVEDVVSWQMRFPSGITAMGSSAFSYQANRFSVEGTEASLQMQPATDYYEHNLSIRTQDSVEEVQIDEANQFARQMDHFSEAILNDSEIRSPGEEGMQDVRLMLAIYEAARTGQPVAVDWEYGRPG